MVMKPSAKFSRALTRALTAGAVLGAFLTSGVAGAAAAAPPDYRLGYGDAVSVTIVGQPDASVQDQAVRPDGKISLPLVNDVAVGGKTVAEVAEGLTQSMRPYFREPRIVVSISRFRPLRVTLLGQVKTPGTHAFDRAPTLVDALATAGGLEQRASRGGIKVIGPDGTAVVYDLDHVLAGRASVPLLQEGTVVEVQEAWGPDLYRVLPLAASLITAAAILIRYY